mgnify:CR=1 FL=1
MILDRIVLGRKPECIPADREQYVVALKPSLAADYLKARISLDMTYVHTCAGGVGELYQRVELRLGVVVFCVERLVFVPVFLPLVFNGGKIITHCFCFLSAG